MPGLCAMRVASVTTSRSSRPPKKSAATRYPAPGTPPSPRSTRMPTVHGEKRCTLLFSDWIAGLDTSMPPSMSRCLWNGSMINAECWSSAAAAMSSCMDAYGETAANVRAETPSTFSSYAMKAWAMCLNCISTWLRPCAECSGEEKEVVGAEALMRSRAEARPANSMRWSAWTATGERLEGEARSRSVRSAGTLRGSWTQASTRSSASGCGHAMVRRL
uniref:Uncharacterized protein n=1 Tax=Arundo donax TaxID=35708 RepID=A0A0A8YLN3_ARUDO